MDTIAQIVSDTPQYIYNNVFTYISIVLLLCASITFFTIKKTDAGSRIISAHSIYFCKKSIALILFSSVLFFSVWSWIVFKPLDFGHKDEIAILTSPIAAQIFSGRFFPLGHSEFNYLSLSFTKNNLAILYLMPMLQTLLFIYLVDRIIWPANLVLRLLALIFTFWGGAIVAFTNLIIPERNAIIFLLLGLVSLKRYLQANSRVSAAASVLFICISLFYKEPMFAIPCAFIFVTTLDNLIQKRVDWLSLPVSLGYGLAVIGFLFGYSFYTFYNGSPSNYYGGRNDDGLIGPLVVLSSSIPILPFTISLVIAAFAFIRNDKVDQLLALTMALGSLVYALIIAVLNMQINGYYLAVPILLSILSFTLVVKNAMQNCKAAPRSMWFENKTKVCGLTLLTLMLVTVLGGISPYVAQDIKTKKNISSQYAFLRSALDNELSFKTIFYISGNNNYGTYQTAVTMIFLDSLNTNSSFSITSLSGCDPWNETYNGGLIHCKKSENDTANQFDLIIAENKSLNSIDTHNYSILEYESPYPNFDGTRTKLSIAVHKHITNQGNKSY